MPPLDNVTRPTHALDDMSGYFITRDDIRSGTVTTDVDTLIDNGLDTYDETALARLPTDTLRTIEDRISALDDSDIGVLEELVNRGRFYGIFTRTSTGDAWYDLGMAIQKELQERYHRHATLIPSYTTVDGVPSSVGNVTTRLLKDWVLEAQIMPASDANSRNPDYKTITAQVDKEIRISADTQGWVGRLHDERAWQLTDIHDDTTFAIAPLTTGEDTTIWPHDDFTDDWSNPWYPVSMTTWPSKTAHKHRD